MSATSEALTGSETRPGRRKSHWPARLDFAQSASGLILGLFMWGHMFFVSSILISNDAMWAITKMFEGYFFFGRALPRDRVGGGCRRLHPVHRSRRARAAQVPHQLRAIPRLPRPHGHDASRGHHAVVVAGRHRLRDVLPRVGAPVSDADAPRNDRPYESADRVWSGRWWPLYLVLLFAVELHGGIGLYRLAVKWGWFAGKDPNASRRNLKRLKWALSLFFIVLGLATLAAYIKIGIAHADRVGERYVPTWQRSAAPPATPAAPQPTSREQQMKIVYTDVLVIGGGLAGLRMAIAAKRRGHDAIILSLVPVKRSHSKAAQGGMQASLGNVIKGQGDNEDVHFEDTVRGSDWGADQDVVRMFVNTAPKAVRELAAWGVPWSRVRKGDRQVVINSQKVTITERDEAHGLVAQRDFGGTKKWRTCYVADGTGHAMITAVADRAIAESIPVHERTEALALIHDGGRCYGAVVRDLVTGELSAYVAKATAIATGGAGRIYQVTTNAVICEGIGHALALETGVAALGNMEAVQFHPTGIFPAGILVTEGLPRRRRAAEGRRRPPLHARLRAREEGARLARRRQPPDGGAHQEGQGREVALRRPPLARHHAARRAPHQAQPARGLRDLPLLPRHRSDQGPDRGAARAALHDGRRSHQLHRREPDAEGTVRGRRSRLLGHARVQPPRRQFGRGNGRRRNDRRRVHRRLLRQGGERRQYSDRRRARLPAAGTGEARWHPARQWHRGCRCDQGPDAGSHDRQGRHLSQRQGPGASGRRTAEAVGAQPQHRTQGAGPRRQSRNSSRLTACRRC